METIKKMSIVLAAVISATMALTACGGDKGADAPAAETTTTAAETTAAAETTTTAAETTTTAAEEKPAETTTTAAPAADDKENPPKKDKSIVAKQKDTKPEAPAEQASPSEYADAIANTVWVGMDANYNCYAMAFTDQEFILEADDDSKVEGYWGVVEGDPTFYVFSDAELTDPIFAIPWQPDFENNVIVLNENIAMTQTEASSFEEAVNVLQQESTVCKIAAYLDGTYWAGQNPDGSYTAMGMENGLLSYYEIEATGEENVGQYYWGLDLNGLTLYNEEFTPLITMGIAIAQDGTQMQMTKEDGQSVVYGQVSQENATNIVAYLHSLVDGGEGAAAEGAEEGAEEALRKAKKAKYEGEGEEE